MKVVCEIKTEELIVFLYSQFHDGVYLIFLVGLLEGFFVPLYQFYITPSNKDQKVVFYIHFCFALWFNDRIKA